MLTTSIRFVLRDYSFDENALERQRQELQTANVSEKELWVGIRPFILQVAKVHCSPDGAAPIIENQFLRSLPRASTPEGDPSVC